MNLGNDNCLHTASAGLVHAASSQKIVLHVGATLTLANAQHSTQQSEVCTQCATFLEQLTSGAHCSCDLV